MHDWLNRTFEQLPEGLGVCRILREDGRASDYVREELNEAYARCLGRRREELRGRTASETASLVPELLELFARADETGKPLSVECHCEAKTFLVSVLPLEPGIASVCLRDITERKQAEREKGRLLEEKMEALEQLDRCKDEFISVLSHELRTPLNSITGFGSLLADRVAGELSEKQGFFVEQILRGADRMITLVDDLLDVALMRTGRFQVRPVPGSLLAVLQESLAAIRPLAERKHLALQLEAEDQVMPFDPVRIRQVLQNLLVNAIHFSDPGKTIRLSTARSESFLLVECQDEGLGISPEKLPLLFSPFQQIDMSDTRKVGGTGLGLCICKAIVEAHGGAIEASSDGLGRGATFRFRLPLGSKPDSVAS